MVAKTFVVVLLISASIGLSKQISTPESPYYTAGVVEFKQASGLLTPAQRVRDNVAAYLDIITSPDASETDIIIFPEATLNNALALTYVPDPQSKIAPCDNTEYADFLQQLSCQAKASQKYIVINVSEKVLCTADGQDLKNDPRPCASYGYDTYNTNVVFDRNGVVVSRYRKYNLYYEPWNVTYTAEYGQFDTDFGVKFGHFICFDILFYTPTTELVKAGITDFIFPTMWFSELPYLTGVQFQQSWSWSYNVNLLAAGASNPNAGNTGSGIYAGKNGVLVSVMSTEAERKLYVARVPKKGTAFAQSNVPVNQLQIRKKRATTSYMHNLLVKRDSRIDDFITAPLDLTLDHGHLCHGDLCCHCSFKITSLSTVAEASSYQYRLAVFNGDRIYPGLDPPGWSVCSIIACINSTLDGCGLSFEDDVSVNPSFRFDYIVLDADFDNTENALLMPNSVDDELMPLTTDEFQFNLTAKGNKINARFELLTPRDNLIAFGIYTNYFNDRSPASAIVAPTLMVFVFSMFSLLIFWKN